MKNIEILDIINNKDITVDTTSIEGITDLYTTSKSTAAGVNANVTAAATTNVNVNATSASTTAADVETIIVKGGKDVTVVSKNNQLDTIDVGTLTGTVVSDAAAGKVSVTSTGADVALGVTLGAIDVNGGTEITVNQYAGKTAGTGNNAGGAVTVNGNASTTTVTVNQTATANGAAATPTTAAVVGYVAGAVTITDVNAASATDAGTITTVTLKNYDDSNIDSGALTTVNLEGTAGTLGITAGSLTTAKVDTLGLNLNGVVGTTLSTAAALAGGGATDNTITVDSVYKTLNVKSSTTASTLTDIITDATAINISGDAALTLTTLTLGAAAGNEVITVTNTAGVTITNALDTDVTFTGGAGKDSVELTTGYTKAINMGAGDDTVVYAVAGAGGSLNGGDGNDTLVVSADSAIAGLPEVSGFEVLRAKGGTANTHNAHTFKALEVGTNATSTTFTHVAAGVGLTVLEANTLTTVTLANATGKADVFNLTLKSALAIDAGEIDLAGVETININSVDTDVTAVAHINKLELTAADATSIVVKGNADIDFTTSGGGNTTAAKVTSFDASALEGDVTFTSTNDTAFAKVTIKGAAGDFVNKLTGGAANDTIIGGAGVDTLDGKAGFNTLTGGAGGDTFIVSAQTVSTGMDKITDFVGGTDKIQIGTAGTTIAANAFKDLRTTDFELSGSLVDAATNALTAAATGQANELVLFTYNSKVYAAYNKDGNTETTFDNDGVDDILIDITGVTGTVTNADFIV